MLIFKEADSAATKPFKTKVPARAMMPAFANVGSRFVRNALTVLACLLSTLTASAAIHNAAPALQSSALTSDGSGTAVKIYPYGMLPSENPDYHRYAVKSPDLSTFGGKTAFVSLRNLGGDYKKNIEQWVYKDRLGNVLWPHYPFIYRKDLPELVDYVRRKGLFIFDIYGYVPGSGTGGVWRQFEVPQTALDAFATLGDHYLGMDNGEQDGRYVSAFSARQYPSAVGRRQQYLNFQHHFEKMAEGLGNNLSTLVSLNFGHYFVREGVYSLIGAETAQGLPNTQVYYSYIRGAGKQYGVSWFGNASIYNRWGFKQYGGRTTDDEADSETGGPWKGTSLSLLKRLMYNHFFYNSVLAGFESAQYEAPGKLSPIGRIQQAAAEWIHRYEPLGTMHTPVALLGDFYSGWTFPRHLYSADAYRVWGSLPYGPGDYLTHDVLSIIYPGYEDASYYHDERGFITPTPYGDIADCLLGDAPEWVMAQYPLIIVAGKLERDLELRDKLDRYVSGGGHLIITTASLEAMPGGIGGAKAEGGTVELHGGRKTVSNADDEDTEIAECDYGKGRLSVICSPYGIVAKPLTGRVQVRTEAPLPNPYPLTGKVRNYIAGQVAGCALFTADPRLSLVTCVKGKGEYNVLVTNSYWHELPINLKSNAGRILSVKELPIPDDESMDEGYMPRVARDSLLGKDGKNTIAGGSLRAFRIKTDGKGVDVMAKTVPDSDDNHHALMARGGRSLREEILMRPTFFRHYDRIVADWRYVSERERDALADEAEWLKLQKVKVSVDLSGGINLFPDLRLVDNDSAQYAKSMATIFDIIGKMGAMHADELILSSMRPIENNITMADYRRSLVSTLRLIADSAAAHGITVVFRPLPNRMYTDLQGSIALVGEVGRANLVFAPSLSMLMTDGAHFKDNLSQLAGMGISRIFVSGFRTDINGRVYDYNTPLADTQAAEAARHALSWFGGAEWYMDANYDGYDAEYKDLKTTL